MYCSYGERVKSYYERYCKEKNDSSNIQSCSFITYLYKNYSLDTVLSYCTTSKTWEDVFQKDYEELKNEWLEYLER
jgi:hypothetical protein